MGTFNGGAAGHSAAAGEMAPAGRQKPATPAQSEAATPGSPRATDAEDAWLEACRSDRLVSERGACALLSGRQVALFRVGAEVFAISNYDPFSRAFVLSRGIVGSKGDILKVASPVYKQSFNLRTGECVENPSIRVPVYQTRVVGGIVQVRMTGHREEPGASWKVARGPLSAFRIAIGETRERERLTEMLRSKGAAVFSCPVVTATDTPDPAAVEQWLRGLARGELDFCIFYTGEGMQRLLATAERMGIVAEVRKALSLAQTIARGPKSARALRELGVLPTLALETPTTEGIIDLLRTCNLRGTTIGVQLYPRAGSRRLIQFLEGAGVQARPVWPYVYGDASHDPLVKDLVARMASGHIDVMVFTSRAQVDRLFDVAARLGIDAALSTGLRRTRIATIGPVVAAAVRARGLKVSIAPAELFYMKSLVNEIVTAAQKATGPAS